MRRTALSVEYKILIALQFFASGSYHRCVGQDLTLAVSQCCVSQTVRAVCAAINNKLLNKYIIFPRNVEDLRIIKMGFAAISNFPGVIGAIDGTLIAIVAPGNSDQITEHLFLGRKGYHCINTQLVCDHKLQILNVNACYPGATHDSFVWRNSMLCRVLHEEYVNGRRNAWLLGDSGYPLEPWLLTPVGDAEENSSDDKYNKAHMKTRNCVERCIGVLKQRFRCLLKHRVLHYKPETAAKIINSCCVLHNICIMNNLVLSEKNYKKNENEDDDVIIATRNNAEHFAAGQSIRCNLIRNNF